MVHAANIQEYERLQKSVEQVNQMFFIKSAILCLLVLDQLEQVVGEVLKVNIQVEELAAELVLMICQQVHDLDNARVVERLVILGCFQLLLELLLCVKDFLFKSHKVFSVVLLVHFYVSVPVIVLLAYPDQVIFVNAFHCATDLACTGWV